MMNKMMETMMAEMMPKMMEKMMESMMTAMMNSMMSTTPEVAPAEVVEVKKPSMTREEFFALADEPKAQKSLAGLDFEPVNAKALKYNGYVPSDVWTVNHLAITREYHGKWSAKLKAYVFENHAAAVNFAQSYKIKTELTDIDRQNVKAYKAERARAKAEYYAKLAEK